MINYVTKVPYTGKNAQTLASALYESPYFLTYLQAKGIGRQVRKGSTGIPLQRIVLVDEVIRGVKRKVRKTKYFTVFNIEQTEEVAA